MLKRGKQEEAIAALQKLRREHPRNAYLAYWLGNLFFERQWWSDALTRYAHAIDNDRSYRKRPTLIRNTIRALGSHRTRRTATSLLASKIGRAGVPYLRTAAKKDKNPQVRERAAALLKRLQKRRR